MNILIISQYFWPENFLINDMTIGLVERGHKITVLTGSPNYPQGRFFPGYGFFNRQQKYGGARVVRVPLIPRGNGGGLRLGLNYCSFAMAASIVGPFICKGKYDAIFVFEPSPITVGIPALVFKRLKAAPVLFWVQDLWPESLAATGAIKNEKILKLVGFLVSFIYRRCDKILIQSEGFRDSVIQQGADPGSIRYFPNSAEQVFRRLKPYTGVIPQLPSGFRVMFAGNIGAAQDFGTIIAAAKLLEAYQDIQWIILGDGRMREWAEAQVDAEGLNDKFHFLGRFPVEAMPDFLSCADALLVTLKKEPIFALTIPSKVQAYLAVGRPIIAAIDGEGAKIVEEAGAGFSCPAEDPTSFAQAVLQMYNTKKEERELMGRNGRLYYEATFDRDMLLNILEVWMSEHVDGRKEEDMLVDIS